MEVFVLTAWDKGDFYPSERVSGVFSSRELADEYARAYFHIGEGYDIEAYSLDQLPNKEQEN